MYIKYGLKQIFIKQKCYRTYMWHLNKVWSTHFVEDSFCFNKIIMLANISNSLEIEFEINISQDSQFPKSKKQNGKAMFGDLFWEN